MADLIQDYLNSLNEAMAIHARKAVEGLAFDRTELAEIVDITNRDKGEYQVFNGSTRYYAYSENTSYTLGAKVYVTIPNNDYSQQKLIKGRYKSGDGDAGIAWTSPLQNYQPSTDNLIEDESLKSSADTFSNSYVGLEGIPVNKNYDNSIGDSLLANYNKITKKSSSESSGSQPQYVVLYKSNWIQEDSQYNRNYQYMGLSAKFKTALSAFYPVSGSYGLLILINYSIKLSGEEQRVNKLKVCKLDTTSMIGSVYNFNTFYKQEALFKLDNEPEHGMLINQVAVLFYQDGEFRKNDNTLISPLSPMDNKPLPDNIFVKDIGIWFGDEIEQDDDDEVEIYTLNGQMYDSAQTNDKLNQKRVHLKWLHVNPVQEEQEDGTKKFVKDLMDSSSLNNVPSAADVPIIANIHWYADAQYTIDTYRATQAATAAKNDKFYKVVEKWKYAPNTLTEEEIQILVQEANWSPKKDYLYQYDESVGRYVLTVTASGEKVLDRVITRNGKEDKATTVNDALAGSGWIPIDGSWNKFEIEYQPDNSRQYSNVKCIIELGPEDGKTGLVNPNSRYYEKLESNVLTFKNLSWVPDIATHDSAAGITLTIDDKTGGHYPIYNATDGRILSRNEVSKLRTIKADMISKYTGKSLFNGNEIILWKIPKTNSMININGTLSESRQEVLTANNFSIISDWFNIKDFNFTDYYYLVRTSLAEAAANQYQGFYINEYYVRSATNNTIFCYIVKNNLVYHGEITLTFAQHGSSGTDYTFSLGLGELVKMPNGVSMGADNNAVDTTSAEWEVVGPAAAAVTIGETAFRRIRFELYDAENNIINLTNEEKNAIISKWIVNRFQDGYYSGYNSSTKNGNAKNLQFLVKREGNYFTDIAVRAPQASITNYRYIILSATVKQSATSTYNGDTYEVGPVNFIQMLPLHFRINDAYNLSGADYITYDDKGSNPQSYSNKYDLLNVTNERFNVIVDGTTVTTDNQGEAYKYYPHLDANGKLVPCSIYVSDLDKNVAIEATVGNNIVYTMPLLIIQNRYQIPAINSWNGELLIDEDNNRVMAATAAAGHKDNQNRFTGVIMGDVGQKDPSSGRIKTTTGLYGYESGAEAFGFKSDGTAFIGKSGTGRIEFDGKDGFIQSANYANSGNGITNKEGTKINLTDGSIDMWGHGYTWTYDDANNKWNHNTKLGTSSNVHIDTYGSITKPYFRIGVPVEADSGGDADGLKSLIRIDSNNYYLQTADYGANDRGLKINLKNGTFDSKGRLTINGANGSSINFGSGNDVVKLGINSNGSAYLSSNGTLTIDGNSNSHIYFGDKFRLNGSGTSTVAGWTINNNNFSGGSLSLNSEGSLYGPSWHIDSSGNAYFNNVFQAGSATGYNAGTGLYVNGGNAYFNGDIYARNGYFKGTVSASTVEGCVVKGGTVYADQLYLNNAYVTYSAIDFVTGNLSLSVETDSVKATDITALGKKSAVTSIDGRTGSDGGWSKDLTGLQQNISESGHSHSIGGVNYDRFLFQINANRITLNLIKNITLTYHIQKVTVLNAGTASSKTLKRDINISSSEVANWYDGDS